MGRKCGGLVTRLQRPLWVGLRLGRKRPGAVIGPAIERVEFSHDSLLPSTFRSRDSN